MDEVRDLAPVGHRATIFTWIWLASVLVTGAAGLTLALFYPPGADPGDVNPATEAGRLLMGMGFSFTASMILGLAAAILSLVWVHRMTTAKRLIAEDRTMSAGWAVGWFFVPVANCVMPFLGIAQAWRLALHRDGEALQSMPAWLWLWWVLWLGWCGLEIFIVQMSNALIETGWMLVLSGVVAIPLAMLWVRIIREVSRALKLRLDVAAFR